MPVFEPKRRLFASMFYRKSAADDVRINSLINLRLGGDERHQYRADLAKIPIRFVEKAEHVLDKIAEYNEVKDEMVDYTKKERLRKALYLELLTVLRTAQSRAEPWWCDPRWAAFAGSMLTLAIMGSATWIKLLLWP